MVVTEILDSPTVNASLEMSQVETMKLGSSYLCINQSLDVEGRGLYNTGQGSSLQTSTNPKEGLSSQLSTANAPDSQG